MADARRNDIGALMTELLTKQLQEMVDKAVAEAMSSRTTGPADEYLDTAHSAEALGTSVRGLQALIARGKIKPDIYGQRGAFRSHRFLRSTLDAYLESKRRDKGQA